MIYVKITLWTEITWFLLGCPIYKINLFVQIVSWFVIENSLFFAHEKFQLSPN